MPLLGLQNEDEPEQQQEIRSAEPEDVQQGDLEQGINIAGAEAEGSTTAEDEATIEVYQTFTDVPKIVHMLQRIRHSCSNGVMLLKQQQDVFWSASLASLCQTGTAALLHARARHQYISYLRHIMHHYITVIITIIITTIITIIICRWRGPRISQALGSTWVTC